MELHLTNFMSHEKATFIFEPGITLIKGVSGVGKTTILGAIRWVLYGGRGVDVCTYGKKSCQVILIHNGNTITRKKGPGLLTIQHKDKEYQNEIAQNIINDIYGSEDVWSCGAYLNQKGTNKFLMGSDKASVLEKLAYQHDQPQERIDQINQDLKALIRDMDVQIKVAVKNG